MTLYVRILIIFFMIFKVMCSFFFISLLILNALYDEMLLTQKMLNKVSFLIYIALHLSFEGNIKEKHCITLIQVRPFQRKYIYVLLPSVSVLMPIEWAKYRDCTNTFIESFGFYSGSFFHFLFDGANEIYLYISSFYMTWTETKGQIMSECIHEIIDFPKYQGRNLSNFYR